MNLQDRDKSQKCAVEACLAAALQLTADGKPEQAEQLFKKALATAERSAGKNSALAGLVLIDLWQFYDRRGRKEEAEQLWKRMREILIGLLPRMTTPKGAWDGRLSDGEEN